MRKALTEEGVSRLKGEAGKQTYYFDKHCTGFVLCLGATKKTWYASFNIGGKTKYHKLGYYPVLNVKQAREKAKKVLADPQAALANVEVGSFREVAADFIKRYVEKKKLRSQREIERCLNKYVLPTWGDLKFSDLKHFHVTKLLDKLEDNHGAPQTDAVLAVIRKIFYWHQSRVGPDYVIPVVPEMNRDVREPDERERTRKLDDAEIKALWEACASAGKFGAMMQLCLLTAQRREKIATLRHSDIKDGVWHIHRAKREKNTPDCLRLPQMALDIIAAQPRLFDNPFVFWGSNRGRRRKANERLQPSYFSAWGKDKAELDAKLPADMPHWTIHDLRRTARSLMSKCDIRPDVVERVLGHKLTGVWRVYDAQGNYQVQIDDALQRLAAKIERIVNPSPQGNVVPLRATR